MWLPCLVLALWSSLWAIEATVDPKQNTVAEEVHEIAQIMLTVENQLRDDKTGETVKADIKEAIDRMEKLIKDAEELEGPDSPYKRGLKALRDSRAEDRHIKPKIRVLAEANDGRYVRYPDSWASLPRAERGEILQVWAREIPLRWQQRIAAYFLSVNAAENEASPKLVKKVEVQK